MRFKLFAALMILMVVSAFAQEWVIPIDVYEHPDSAREIVAQTSIYGSDLYDSTVVVGIDSFLIDKAAPPAPPSGLSAFFPLDDPSYSFIGKLMFDGRSAFDDTILWTIQWAGVTALDSVTVEWDPLDVPSGGVLLIDTCFIGSDVAWATAHDMSSVSSVTGNGVLNWVQIRYTRVVPDVDSMPPYFTNWHPADGAIDVPETTTTLSVDIMDVMSPVDESSIRMNVAGLDVPAMFLSIADIAGGKRASVNTGGAIAIPPGSTIVCIACAGDTARNYDCDTISFTTHDTLTTIYCVEGTVGVGGYTDLSGSIAIVGAYHDSTDASGYYEVCAPEGSYMLYVLTMDGRTDSVEIDLNSNMTHNFSFPQIIGDISGTVLLDGETDHSGTIVTESESGASTTTAVTGAYTLTDVDFGTVYVSAAHAGFESKTDTFDLTSDTSGVDFLLFPLTSYYNVSGTLTLEGETVHSGIAVDLSDGLTFDESTITNAAGYFDFDSVPAGGYTLGANYIGFEDFDTSLTVVADVVVIGMLEEESSVMFNPPTNVQSTTRPCWPGAFNVVTWDAPMMADTVKLAHCSARGYGDTRWGGFSTYYGYGWIGGGYSMPFVAPEDDMTLSKVRIALHPSSYGITTMIGVWSEDPDSGGPGTMITHFTGALNDTVDGWAYIDVPDVTVGTDPFFVGWIDQMDSPSIAYVMMDYTSPDTLAWVHNAYDSMWNWEGNNVDMADGDFAIECYVSGGSSRAESFMRPSYKETLQRTKIPNVEAAKAAHEYGFRPMSLEGPHVDLASATAPSPRMRPAEMPTSYLLYRDTAPFTDTSVADFVIELDDTMPYYLDATSIDDVIYYYGMIAVYPGGMSDLSELAKGYNRNPPAATNVLLIDWCGGWQMDSLHREWDSSDTLVTLLSDVGFTGDSLYVTREQERLYGYILADSVSPLYDLIIVTWSPFSASGWLGPRPRGPEWRKLDDYLRKGGNLFIEGADAMEILSGDGYAMNRYDSLYLQFGVNFRDGGIASLDTGNVRQLTSTPSLFSGADTVDYSLSTIADYGLDEFEHQMGTGAVTVLWSQLIGPMPHESNGRGVWFNNGLRKTYVQSPYFGAIINIPTVGSKEIMFAEMLDGFGVNPVVQETKTSLPGEMTLFANIPNPFNAKTEIVFDIERPCEVDLSIYNMMGQKVSTLVSGMSKPGIRSVVWDGADFSGHEVESGVYFYRLETDAGSITKRMVLLK